MNDFASSENEHGPEAERRRIIGIALEALEAAQQLHDRLGETGQETLQKNQFGETALRIDVECEQLVIKTFRASGIPIRIVSEEHGVTELSDHPEYFAVLDGLDGTQTYRQQRGSGRYGTMLGIFTNAHPKYQDYLFGGVAEHGLHRLIFAKQGEGAFMRQGDKDTPIHTSGSKEVEPKTSFGVDEYFAFNRDLYLPVFEKQRRIIEFSSESRYVDVATGQADLGLESTRKGNLEIAAAYGIIREAGGVMVDQHGQDIGEQEYEKFGQAAQVPIITAATPELAKQVVELIRQHRRAI